MARVEFDQELERLETEIKIMASTVESSIEKSINSLLEQDIELAKSISAEIVSLMKEKI